MRKRKSLTFVVEQIGNVPDNIELSEIQLKDLEDQNNEITDIQDNLELVNESLYQLNTLNIILEDSIANESLSIANSILARNTIRNIYNRINYNKPKLNIIATEGFLKYDLDDFKNDIKRIIEAIIKWFKELYKKAKDYLDLYTNKCKILNREADKLNNIVKDIDKKIVQNKTHEIKPSKYYKINKFVLYTVNGKNTIENKGTHITLVSNINANIYIKDLTDKFITEYRRVMDDYVDENKKLMDIKNLNKVLIDSFVQIFLNDEMNIKLKNMLSINSVHYPAPGYKVTIGYNRDNSNNWISNLYDNKKLCLYLYGTNPLRLEVKLEDVRNIKYLEVEDVKVLNKLEMEEILKAIKDLLDVTDINKDIEKIDELVKSELEKLANTKLNFDVSEDIVDTDKNKPKKSLIDFQNNMNMILSTFFKLSTILRANNLQCAIASLEYVNLSIEALTEA